MAVARVRAETLAAEALTPIRETLSHMGSRPDLPPLTGIAPGLIVADQRGWTRATDVVSGAAIDDLLDAAAQRWHAAPHAAAALAFKHYAYWLALPAVLGYATVARVPLMRPDAVLLRWSAEKPFIQVGLAPGLAQARRGPDAATGRGGITVAVLPADPLLLHGVGRGIRVVPHDDALLDELRTALMEEHLTPVLAHIRSRVHLGRRTLWGSLASGVAHGLSRAADVIPGPTIAAAEAVLTTLGVRDLVSVGERTGGGLAVQRHTCCLAFTLPEPHRKVCSGCCIPAGG
ncbi:MAG TPA: hypothetical protein VH561_07185 [Micromonosporaceae bacterium]